MSRAGIPPQEGMIGVFAVAAIKWQSKLGLEQGQGLRAGSILYISSSSSKGAGLVCRSVTMDTINQRGVTIISVHSGQVQTGEEGRECGLCSWDLVMSPVVLGCSFHAVQAMVLNSKESLHVHLCCSHLG